MRTFRHAVGQVAWLIGIQLTVFFFVVGLSAFMVKEDKTDSEPSKKPISHCDTDHLLNKIKTCLRILLITVLASALFTLAVRVVVDALAESEDRAIKKEDEVYEAAVAEVDKTNDARHAAAGAFEKLHYSGSGHAAMAVARGKLLDATRSGKHAVDEVARLKPKYGIARLIGWKRKCLRFAFCLAIISSLGTSACASFAFYYSLQLQLLPKIVCVNGAPQVSPFVVIGFVALLIHVFLLWIASTHN